MKLVIIIMITCLVQVSAASFGQTLTYSKKGATLNQIFNAIKSQTGYNVFFSNEMVDKNKKIDVNFHNTALGDVMNELSIKSELEYKIDDRNISVKPKTPSFLDRLVERFANIDVRGRVVDSAGNALAGATVKIKGTNRSVKTDQYGAFYLENVGERSKLVISYIGYQNREVNAASDMGSLTMVVADAELQEVKINAGYYSVTDKERTGNISRITKDEIERQPINNPLQALQGRVPGMVIEQVTGVPGGNFNVQIRGRSSLNSAVRNNPLYIIDGVIFPDLTISSGVTLGTYGSTAGSSPLSSINPYDIESIEILKDADATSIYGSRGANGVVLITTKRGISGDTRIDATFAKGVNRVGHFMNLLNSQQYLEMRNEAFKNDNLEPSTTDYDVNGTWDLNKNTDWQKELIGGTGNTNNLSLSVSGGVKNNNYVVGANYYDESTVFPGDFGFTRASAHSNLNFGSNNDRFNAGFTLNVSRTGSKLFRNDPTSQIMLAPNAPNLFDEFGNVNWANGSFAANPASYLLTTNNISSNTLIGNLSLSYKFSKHLTFKASVGYSTISQNEFAKIPLESISPSYGPTSASRIADYSNNFNNSLRTESQFDYSETIGIGELSAILGMSFQNEEREISTIRGSGFNSDDLMANPASAALLRANGFINSQYKYLGVFSRINYNVNNRYILNLTARRDGSSRFGDGRQFANFGAVGAAWIFSEESWFKESLPIFSTAKIRGSYGITGNDQIPDYGYLQSWNSQNTYLGIPTISPDRIANSEYAWEKNKKLELALQLGMFGDRIIIESSYYRNRTSNQLIDIPIPLSTGNGSIQANVPAIVQNTGWELMTDVKLINTKNVSWTFSGNLTFPKNKLVSYPDDINRSYYAGIFVVGKPLSITKTFNVKGIDQQSGLYDIEDYDGNGTLNLDDRYLVKFMGQKFYGGINNSVRVGSFNLDFLLSFARQNGFNYMNDLLSPGYFDPYSITSNHPDDVLRRWQGTGQISPIQKFSTGFDALIQYLQAIPATGGGLSITDASYIRLKNISISYTVPALFSQKLKIKQAQLSLQGQNVFTLTNYVGLDPETRRINYLPPLRSLSLGLKLAF